MVSVHITPNYHLNLFRSINKRNILIFAIKLLLSITLYSQDNKNEYENIPFTLLFGDKVERKPIQKYWS